MKHIIISFFTLHFSLFILTAFAAVPLRWTVETSRATPAQFEAYQGETISFEAALQSYGKPLEAPSNYSFFWQTNGMGNVYWSTNCNHTIEQSEQSNNVLRATWTPSMETGARAYNCFIGVPGTIYHTAFQLRLRPSPGATPNALPLPVPVIDFAKVRVLNPPWGAGGVDTNAVIDIIHKTVDGAARPLPKYLWLYEPDDSYPEDSAWYYAQPQDYGQCSAIRDGGFLYRNYDWKFDDAAEFVVKVSQGPSRFASVGVANCGTNLTESFVTSGKPSRYYKCLPGRVVDGINENGVVCEVNVVDGSPQTNGWHTTGDIHPLAAVRWSLDNGTSAGMVASNLASRIAFPQGWAQNFHWMVADESQTWIVENGTASNVTGRAVMTNFEMFETWVTGGGLERYNILVGDEPITNAWFTRAYSRQTYWISDFRDAAEMEAAKMAWETHSREELRGKGMWQSVHTSVYDITNRVLRVAVQEVDDWYTFSVPGGTGVSPVQAREIAEDVASGKLDGPTVAPSTEESASGKAADAKATAIELSAKLDGPIDETLSVPGLAADAAKVGEELSNKADSSMPAFFDFIDIFYVYQPRNLRIYFDGEFSYDDGDGNTNVMRLPTGGVNDYFATEGQVSGKADRAELTAATNEVIHVIKDAAKNLKYTITGDNGRFYMTPIGAINPED